MPPRDDLDPQFIQTLYDHPPIIGEYSGPDDLRGYLKAIVLACQRHRMKVPGWLAPMLKLDLSKMTYKDPDVPGTTLRIVGSLQQGNGQGA